MGSQVFCEAQEQHQKITVFLVILAAASMAFASPIPRAQFDFGQFLAQAAQVAQPLFQQAPQTNSFDSFNNGFQTQSASSGGGGYGPRPGTRKPQYGRK